MLQPVGKQRVTVHTIRSSEDYPPRDNARTDDDLWHKRMGHGHDTAIDFMIRRRDYGIDQKMEMKQKRVRRAPNQMPRNNQLGIVW